MTTILLSALIPLLVGFIYYNPAVLGNAWMKACGFTKEQMQGANMPLIFGITFVFGVLIAMALAYFGITVHQAGLGSLMADPKRLSPEQLDLFKKAGEASKGLYRTFGHGALHGAMSGVFIALPIFGINALFERRGFKYILIHLGYWIITLALMGGVICQWS